MGHWGVDWEGGGAGRVEFCGLGSSVVGFIAGI